MLNRSEDSLNAALEMFRRKEYDASAVFFYYSILQRMMFALAHSKEKPITYDKQNPLNEDLHKKLKFEICNRIRDGKEAKSVGKFTLPGFGILKLVQRAARMGRNPATGEQIKIPAKTVVKFSVAKAAKEAIAGKAPAKKK